MTAKRQNKSNKPQRIAGTKEPDQFVYAAADVFFSSMQPDEETSVDDPSGKKTKKRIIENQHLKNTEKKKKKSQISMGKIRITERKLENLLNGEQSFLLL